MPWNFFQSFFKLIPERVNNLTCLKEASQKSGTCSHANLLSQWLDNSLLTEEQFKAHHNFFARRYKIDIWKSSHKQSTPDGATRESFTPSPVALKSRLPPKCSRKVFNWGWFQAWLKIRFRFTSCLKIKFFFQNVLKFPFYIYWKRQVFESTSSTP